MIFPDRNATPVQFQQWIDQKASYYNQPSFIESDPVSVPHLFSDKADIEIAAFLVCTIAWGNRKFIIDNGMKLMRLMEMRPHDFVMHFSTSDLKPFARFVHRTFNATDLEFFLFSLKNLYQQHGGLENVFTEHFVPNNSIKDSICGFRKVFFEIPHPARTTKHISNPAAGASAKRLNMFLRWMVRSDSSGVDFGIWRKISAAHLMCPLDVHSGRVARMLGLLQRKQDDWRAVEELTGNLRKLKSNDPVVYDYALFGMGVFEKSAKVLQQD